MTQVDQPVMRGDLGSRRARGRWLQGLTAALALALVVAPAAPVSAVSAVSAGSAGDPGAVRAAAEAATRQLASVELDPAGAIRVDGFHFTAGLATIQLIKGTLIPATAVGDHSSELVFIGRGRLVLAPEDTIERSQLKHFTGDGTLDETFDRAVFVINVDEAVETALSREAAGRLAPEMLTRARELLTLWHESPERKLLDVEARIFADALGDPLAHGFFCGYIHGLTLGDMLLTVDPFAAEQLTLGSFVKAELDRRERRQLQRRLDHSQREGKLIGVELNQLGRWTPWLSCSLAENGIKRPGTPGIEARHYDLDVTLGKRDLEMEATARLKMEVLVDGLRTVTLQTHADLEIASVSDRAGRSLPFLQTQQELTIALAEPASQTELLELVVGYRARPFRRTGPRSFSLRLPLEWHPRAGAIDRATFEATVHWPEELDLVGNGTVIAEGRDDDGLRWQRRRAEVACTGFSFEIGQFSMLRRQVGHVAVTVAIDRHGREVAPDLEEDILATVQDSLAYFEATFGAYPLEKLEVVTSPRTYSQGLMGFITLSTTSMVDPGEWGAVLGIQDRRTIIAHEVAHQWWGNLVGWRSYRDQWISEAMANYAALLYTRHRLQRPGEPRVWRGPTTGWSSWLLATTDRGQTVESLGPVVLGTRLWSAYGLTAYQAIVYKKGAVILDMLARLFKEDEFITILRSVVERAANHTISTDELIGLVESTTGLALGWFTDQYIRGTGLPTVYYSYQISRRDDGWIITGTCRQSSPHEYRFRVVRAADGALDVVREARAQLEVDGSILVVPFQIELAPHSPRDLAATQPRDVLSGDGLSGDVLSGDVLSGDATAGSPGEDTGRVDSQTPAPGSTAGQVRTSLVGTMILRGVETPFEIETDHEPEVLWLDPGRDVFGRFFCHTCWPKQSLLSRGLDLMAEGDPTAEQTLAEALEQPFTTVDPAPGDSPDDLRWRERILDIQIRLALTRLFLDTRRINDARAELSAVTERITRGDRWQLETDLAAMQARVDLHSGQPADAYELLASTLSSRRSTRSAETYALLAVAAFEAGKDDAFEDAVARASELDADMQELVEAAHERQLASQ